ncbi:gibberellin 3-beta-dioxygenase 3 [Cajanus cajan]|uniref:Gibberellin 3-beta-dioxygenase 3 n=1 Tax=Cajanus cajan TaxID=3821 RepID=A0A151SLP5_CAJCA|nr:gibberellin 3-beta-dioxygenase 3 [Cajanus cajan]KYP55669.1 Gibberellin 3-beta-dioxygenase 3 [Cajanus cajan]
MNSISDSYKNKPSHHHIVPLDFKNVHTVPDSHKWENVEPHTSGSVPSIDLCDPNAKSLIGEACEKWGVFYVTNHGVPTNLFKKVEQEAFRLFNLPTDQKLGALRLPDGVTGYGMPRTTTYGSKLLWAESFFMIGSPMEHATQLWPHQTDQQTTFCAVMEECQKEMKRSSGRVMELILESLGLNPEELTWVKPKDGCKEAQSVLSLNSYPVCPEPEKAMGLGPHTDTSLLTVLYQSGCTGLQVFRDGIGWIPVQPVPGALVVNAGDLLHVLSNGRFKNVLHRAVVNNEQHRISVAHVYGPPADVKISPLMKVAGDDDDDHDPPLFSPVTWKEYIYAKSVHYDKALEFIKVTAE